MITQLSFLCIVNTAIPALIAFVTVFWLSYRISPRIVFREPKISITAFYTIKEDGSIERVESLPLPPEKREIVEEKIRVLKEELKREAAQKLTEK